MTDEDVKLLLSKIEEMIDVLKKSDASRSCKIHPYLFRIEVNWKTIIATVVGLLAIIDRMWSKF